MKKHVVIFTSEYPKPSLPFQGAFTAQFVKELSQQCKVTVICPIPWLPKLQLFLRLFPAKKPWTEIPKQHQVDNVTTYYLPFFTVPFFFRYLNALSIALFSRRQLKKIDSNESVHVIHAHGVYPDAVAASLLGKWFKRPTVITALGSDVNKEMQVAIKQKQSIWALNRASAVAGVSKDLVNTIVNYGIDQNKVHWVPTGVCRNTFNASANTSTEELNKKSAELRASVNLDASAKIALFVGRLHPVKGLDVLLNAVAILQKNNRLDFTIVLIGEGSLLDSLSQSAETLGISDAIKFIGPQPQQVVAQWMQAANLLCLPSHMEGLPNVILEALALSLPIVASNVGGIPEVVINDSNGVLVPANDADQLAEALEYGLTKEWDKTKIAQSVDFARWESIVEKYLAIYAASAE